MSDDSADLQKAVALAAQGKIAWDKVVVLLKEGTPIDDPRSSPGPMADLAVAPAPVLRLAIAKGGSVNPRSRKELPLVRAVRANLPANVRLLLAAGARPNERDDPRTGNSAVDAWASWGLQRWTKEDAAAKRGVLKALVAAGANLERPGGMENAPPLWRLLLWHCVGNDPASGDNAAGFHRAEADLAIMLLKTGVNPNGKCPFNPETSGGRIPRKATPLFIRPVMDGSLHRALLQAGADPSMTDAFGHTPQAFMETYRAELIERGARHAKSSKTRAEPLFADDPAIVARVIRMFRGSNRPRTK